MGSNEESPDKCSWEGCNLEDPAAGGPVQEPL